MITMQRVSHLYSYVKISYSPAAGKEGDDFFFFSILRYC
jgi:hypothetical protein